MNAILTFMTSYWVELVLTFPLWGPALLLVLYATWVQHERGGVWEVFQLVAMVGYPWDWLMQYTLASLYFWEFPEKGEATVSMRLVRLVQRSDWRGVWARRLAWLLNKLSPKGVHVPVEVSP